MNALDLPEGRLADREVEALRFAGRVLELAEDTGTDLASRCRFLTLVQSNVDAFLAVRGGALHATRSRRVLAAVRRELRVLDERVDNTVAAALSDLADKGARLRRWSELDQDARAVALATLATHSLPTPTPIGVWQGFPVLEPERLHLVGQAKGQLWHVRVPDGIDRLVALGDGAFVAVEEVLGPALLPESTWATCRVVRSAEVTAAPDNDADLDVDDLVAWSVHARRYGVPVRLRVAGNAPQALVREVAVGTGTAPIDISPSRLPLDLRYLLPLAQAAGLSTPSTTTPRAARLGRSWFEQVREGDRLLHHPGDDFDSTVLRLLTQAAHDERVESIDVSLYRLAPSSAVVDALCTAARRGATVRAVMEARARFDEEHNVACAEQLRAAGVEVGFGLARFKTHAKLLVLRRRDDDGLRTYAHIGTGNYHEGTAATYEDLGLLTVDPSLTATVARVLDALIRGQAPHASGDVLVAPGDLRAAVQRRIGEVAAAARAGLPARIQLKVNALTDADVAARLVAAAADGVEVDLLVRGACVVRPVEGVRVRSIAGHVLQHSRIYRFVAGDSDGVFIGSADLMTRNLDTRVEVAVPVRDERLGAQLRDLLAAWWDPRPDAWDLDLSGAWRRYPRAE